MKRIISENKWRVSLVTPDGQIIEKVVDAPTMGDAIRRAQQSFQGKAVVQGTANQIDPGLNTPTNQAAQQNMLPKQLAGLQPIKQLTQPGARRESFTPAIDTQVFNYPYSITLPSQFKKILHETSPVRVNELMGQYFIVLEDKDEMREFLQRLRNNRDRGSSAIIVSGVRSSIA